MSRSKCMSQPQHHQHTRLSSRRQGETDMPMSQGQATSTCESQLCGVCQCSTSVFLGEVQLCCVSRPLEGLLIVAYGCSCHPRAVVITSLKKQEQTQTTPCMENSGVLPSLCPGNLLHQWTLKFSPLKDSSAVCSVLMFMNVNALRVLDSL